MRAIVKRGDEVINTIEIDDDCIEVTEQDALSMPEEAFVFGKYYILPPGTALERLVD